MSRIDDAAAALADLRGDEDRRRRATAGAALVGIGLAWFHWLGLVLGGALVAIPRRRLLTAPLAGLGFGVLVLATFGAYLLVVGSLGPAVGMGRITLVAVGIGLGLPVVGSLIRGVF